MAVILVTSRSFGDGDLDLRARVAQAGHELLGAAPHHDRAELCAILPRVDAWIAGTGPVTDGHLDAAPRLKVIARYGVGTEAVDLDAASRRGIVVTNTPGANADAVADHALGLMLAALRHSVAGDRRLRAGDWSARRGRELGHATVGIVGFGRIGQGVARRLAGFGSRVLATDPVVPAAAFAALGAERCTVADVLGQADVITLHAPGGRCLVDAAALTRMRPGAVLVNTARADLVDEHAVAHALRAGTLGAYAADVLTGDTAAHAGPLLAGDLADRVVVTPHLGAQTVQAVDNMGAMALENALAVLEGRTPPHPVTRREN